MTKLRYQVPLVAQANSNSCWNASAQMIWAYWQGQSGRQGPMHSLADHFANARTITPPHDFIKLAQNVGLSSVSFKHPFTGESIYKLLKANGPLWCAGEWYGFGHIIVLTGVDGSQVYINDPDGGVAKIHSVSWFNSKIHHQVTNCIMRKDPKRY